MYEYYLHNTFVVCNRVIDSHFSSFVRSLTVLRSERKATTIATSSNLCRGSRLPRKHILCFSLVSLYWKASVCIMPFAIMSRLQRPLRKWYLRLFLLFNFYFLWVSLWTTVAPDRFVERSRSNAAQQSERRSFRRMPAIPADKLIMSKGDSTAIWCQFVSLTLPLLSSDIFRDRTDSADFDKIVLLVDDRETLAHFWSIPWTMALLGPDWRLQILTREKSRPFYRAIVDHYDLRGAFIDTFEERYGYGPWIPDYFMHRVQYMVSAQFWDGVRAEYILVIQDNGVPLRRIDSPAVAELMKELFKYGYAGAPWNLDEGNRPGGNGGFSFRRRSVLVQHSIDLNVSFADLLKETTDLNPLGQDNEDAVLGGLLSGVAFGVAPKHLEHRFACELLFQPAPFGVHHFAPRHSTDETLTLVRLAIAEFLARNASEVFELSDDETASSSWTSSWKTFQELFPKAKLPFECSQSR